jgi:hypothetical protein
MATNQGGNEMASQVALALDEAKTELHVEALDLGHDLHGWVDDETFLAHCVCRRCGAQMVVRVYADRRVWKKRVGRPCPKATS